MPSSKVVMVRMNKDLNERFDALREQFQGLPPSTIARMVVSAVLSLSLEEQIEMVESQVRKPGSPPKRKANSRIPGVNSRKSRRV